MVDPSATAGTNMSKWRNHSSPPLADNPVMNVNFIS